MNYCEVCLLWLSRMQLEVQTKKDFDIDNKNTIDSEITEL